jgi:lysozyme family protein
MASFDAAVRYALESEGRFSNDKADRGGETWFGISRYARADHIKRCEEHRPLGMNGLLEQLRGRGGRELALHIYRSDFWRFDGIRDQRVATKLFDIVINVGSGMRIIQRVAGVKVDGIYGRLTEAALNKRDPLELLEALSLAVGDHYVRLAVGEVERELRARGMTESQMDLLQMTFLAGWVARAIRRPRT